MTDKTSAGDDSCSTVSCCAWKFAAALLLLRLCIGWHFFSEGTKKLSYDEGRQAWNLEVPTEIVFRNATGPLAGLFKSQLPGFYDWENLLAVPVQSKPRDAEAISKRQDWLRGYAARRATAKKEKKPEPIEFPDFAPYKPWAEKIVEGLRNKLKAFTDLSGVTEAQAAEAAELFVARHQQLADFLGEEAEAIEEYQHELWRLQNLQQQGGAEEIPFREERVAAKKSETISLGGRLVSQVRGIESGFNNDLRGVLTAEQRGDATMEKRVDASLSDSKARRMHWLNVGVTCLIIGVGACLLLGLFTRLAAVGGMLFLLSVMVTQLPWVPGADTKFFYYQLVEFVALLTLLVSGPWRLPSLDYLLRGLWCACCGAKGIKG